MLIAELVFDKASKDCYSELVDDVVKEHETKNDSLNEKILKLEETQVDLQEVIASNAREMDQLNGTIKQQNEYNE